MNYEYIIYQSLPSKDILNSIQNLHRTIFGSSDDLIKKMTAKPKLLMITTMEDDKVIGYKIGYELEQHKFYSWLGGVDPAYRNLGIASVLMEKQHQYLKQNSYNIVQTKTMNKWRNMLILNIKNGFDVIETYTDEKGRHKIILEKNLLD
ncbi:acetyltransferase (GNAT) family protein [Bacillus oleivorans]|uniref:Acetyltransferase (GNAT) family protein n=1 Tax=Bacillus oleivorans TaxID=1448271 RepID=A0A285D4S4_9BACI|nr:GNAT family N-acetyltransferase [Bacillus oleivorans]SNX74817.1 acetyltransferase (GNAT) family protein [Bacillus oleivorans]